MLEFVEEAFDEIALSVETFVEGRQVDAVGHEPDVGAGTAHSEALAQGIGVVTAIAQEHIATAERAQHVVSTASVMGLAFGEFEKDRQATGIDEGVDFGRQPTARATHATGSRRFFWPLAACWCTRIEEESIIWMLPS